MAIVALAGCGAPLPAPGGSAASVSAAGVSPSRILPSRASAVVALPRRVSTSWMLPEAKSQNLMYVSDAIEAQVYVFTYPGGKLVGSLSGFGGPAGMCADSKGNIWVTDGVRNSIYEFAHGGTTPIATLTQPSQDFVGCSVDQSSGALAVDSFCVLVNHICEQAGGAFVYTNTKSAPKEYGVLNAYNVYFCGYDASGNLFVDVYFEPRGPFELGELPKGGSSFSQVFLNRLIYFPGNVQWDGKHLAVGDQEAGNEITSSVHQVALKGNRGTVVGTTRLAGTADVVQFWIQGSSLIAPNLGVGSANDAPIFKYPAGGAPTRIVGSDLFQLPEGAAVSLASK